MQESDYRSPGATKLHSTKSLSHHDFPYSSDILSKPYSPQQNFNLKRTLPRRLPSIQPAMQTRQGGSGGTAIITASNQRTPFTTFGGNSLDIGGSSSTDAHKGIKGGGISVGGLGYGHRNPDSNFHKVDFSRSTVNSPQKRAAQNKSQNSWHSDGLAAVHKEMNPEPLPFMASEFKSPLERIRVKGVPLPGTHIPKDVNISSNENSPRIPKSDRSSTMIKKFPLHQRHGDMWAGDLTEGLKPKGIALHTDRYGFEEIKKSHDLYTVSSRYNETHYEFLSRMRVPKKSKEQQEPLNLVMGGQQCGLFERDDIQGELRKLKGIVLPSKAKDLYVGRGFKMPSFHAVNNPRPARDKPLLDQKKPDYYINRTPSRGKQDGNWYKTELKDEAPDTSHTAVVLPRENTMEMGTDPLPKSATTKHTAATPNPLKSGAVENFIESIEFEKLKKTFKRLDTDMDGHLQFLQLKSQLPKGLSHAQERFIKTVYDLTSASTFFGLNEYISISIMCQKISSLQGAAKEAFQKINFASIEKTVQFYTDLFQSMDRSNLGKISTDALEEIINMSLEQKISNSQFKEIMNVMQVENTEINKMDYLAYIPYFLTLETMYVH